MKKSFIYTKKNDIYENDDTYTKFLINKNLLKEIL